MDELTKLRDYSNAEKLISTTQKETAKKILSNIKEMLVDRYEYFAKLRNKNIIANTESSNENALFDLGEMDAFSCIISRVKELAKEHGVEV